MTVEQVKFFKSLKAVRQRTSLLLKYPNHLQSFDVHLEKLPNVIDDIIKLIERDYKSPKDIPMHSRWRHFEAKPIAGTPNPGILEACSTRIQDLTGHWRNDLHIDEKEILRRLLDLSVVSVLLDAGAGPQWKYTAIHEGGTVYNRSEGLGIASLVWFNEGGFSSKPFQCDSNGLKNITVKGLETAFQVSSDNPLVGVEGRCKLLQNLGKVLENNPKYFGSENPRPGNLLDFLLTHKDTVKNESGHTIPLHCLWEVVVEGFSGVWPATRTKIDGISLGDVWPTKAMKLIHTKEKLSPEELKGDDENLVAFHKLSQWLTYSLLEPLALSGIHFTGTEDMTGLAEYRNGGLFVDYGVLSLKDQVKSKFPAGTTPKFEVFDDTIVEWRGLTVALLDIVGKEVRSRLNMSEKDLPLVKVLEAGSWKLGREIAAKLRPDTKSPPIDIISDGTVF